MNCGKGSCSVINHGAVCTCFQGYYLFDGICEDIDECLNHPCHSSAICQNLPGSFVCSCPEGLVGDPVSTGCRNPGECLTDSDCPSTAACENSRCKNPCEKTGACGRNAVCNAVSHSAVCKCPSNSYGNPHNECIHVECSDNNDCASERTCVNSKCINPCSLSNVCGQQAECVPQNHIGVCTCLPGTTGNPLLGCTALQYCNSDSQCPSGTICNNGLCCSLCTSNRDCIGEQLCIKGVCQPTCKSNSSCPDFQYCLNNICTQEVRCRSDDDCEFNENCVIDNFGRANCQDSCLGRVLCGRNAECTARNHNPDCECKDGFIGDPKIACRKMECQSDDDCSNDKTCDNYSCKIACLIGQPCGENALCSAENHKQVCHCQPGYTGDPKVGCVLIDYCKDSPCGPGAQCKNSRGTFKCSCPPGLVGNAYNEGCHPAVECQTNDECPLSAICSQINGIPKCKDVCEGQRCGPNADCVSKSHTAYCACKQGYDGDANDLRIGCQPLPMPCQIISDCPPSTYCSEGICKRE